jgi:hypothetical protein
MKFTEIASRLNGFTLGPFGAQWTPKPSDVEIARRTIRFLEDRRILYNECAHEEATHCVESVLEIRRVLTDEIKCLGDSSDLLGPLRVMRAACRKFLDRMQYDFGAREKLPRCAFEKLPRQSELNLQRNPRQQHGDDDSRCQRPGRDLVPSATIGSVPTHE